MTEQIAVWNDWVNGYVWGLPLIILLIGTGLLLTVITGFAEFVADSLSDNIKAAGDVAEIIKAADRAAALTWAEVANGTRNVYHSLGVDL